MTEQPADAQNQADEQYAGPVQEVQSGGVRAKPNPKLRAQHGVVIPGVGHFDGPKQISKSQFNDLEKNARHRATHRHPEGFPLLVKDEEE